MILVNATFIKKHEGLIIAKSDQAEEYEVYYESGFVERGFESIQQAEDFIESMNDFAG